MKAFLGVRWLQPLRVHWLFDELALLDGLCYLPVTVNHASCVYGGKTQKKKALLHDVYVCVKSGNQLSLVLGWPGLCCSEKRLLFETEPVTTIELWSRPYQQIELVW